MPGSLTAQLVATNALLTEQLVRLATSVIEAGIKPSVVLTDPAVPVIPPFEEFAAALTPAEKLFYADNDVEDRKLFLTEEEEDEEYANAITGDTSSNPQLTKKLLEAAGHHDLAAQVTAT